MSRPAIGAGGPASPLERLAVLREKRDRAMRDAEVLESIATSVLERFFARLRANGEGLTGSSVSEVVREAVRRAHDAGRSQ